MRKFKKIVSMCILLAMQANAMQAMNFEEIKKFGSIYGIGIGAYIGINCVFQPISLIAHECGHAFMGKLFGSPLDINFGGYHDKKPLRIGTRPLKLGPITIRGLNPWKAFCSIKDSEFSIAQKVLTFLAGPLAGSASYLVVARFFKNDDFKLLFYGIAVIHLTENLNPYEEEGDRSDGALIIKTCFPETKANKIISIGDKVGSPLMFNLFHITLCCVFLKKIFNQTKSWQ